MFISWYDIMSTKNQIIKKNSKICELHFKPEDITKKDGFVQADGTVIYVPRKIPKLKGAVPSIFPIKKISYFEQIEHNNDVIISYEKCPTECEISEIVSHSTKEPIPSTSHMINLRHCK